MPSPTRRTLTGTFQTPDGTPLVGKTVTFQLLSTLTDANDNVIVAAEKVPATLDASGTLSVELVSDAGDVAPQPVYFVRELFGDTRGYNIVIPAGSGSVDLSTLAPVGPSPTPPSAYALLSVMEAADAAVLAAAEAYTDTHGGGGGGAVASVNGHTGVVTLGASDVGADASGAAATAQAAAVATAATDATTKANAAQSAATAAAATDATTKANAAQAAAIAASAQRASNLSDLASAATARTNLGLGTAATQASTAFDAAGAAAAAQAASQPLDSDLTALAALDSTQVGTIGSTGAGWILRSWAQVKTALGLTKADVGLGNVDNVADASKPVSTAQAAADATVQAAAISAAATDATTKVATETTRATGVEATKADLVGGKVPTSQLPTIALTPTAVKTANYTAAASDFVPVDTTSGNVTVTLPTAPADKTQIGVKHVIRGGSNTVTIVCGGSDVFNKTGGSTSATLTLVNQGAVLQYKASGAIWYVVSDDLALSQLDARFAAIGTTLNDRGAWTTGLVLVVNDTVTYNFSRYVTKAAHTAGASFDPTKFVQTGNLNGRCIRIPDGWGTYWKAARATAGSALVPVLADGDSLTEGQSATNGNSFVGLLTSALQTAYGDGGSGFVGIARQAPRGGFTFAGGTWTSPFSAILSVGPGGAQGAYCTTAAATATVTGRGTTMELYYLTSGSSGTGQATVAVDGGSAVTINQNRNDGTTINKVSRYRVTGLSAGNHTVVFTTVGTGGLPLIGARFTNAAGVVVDNHGAPARRSGAAAFTTAGVPSPGPWHGGYEMPAYLAIWAYGVNDVAGFLGTVTTVQQYNLALTLWCEQIMEATHGRADLIIVAPHVGQWESLSDLSGSVPNSVANYSQLVAEMRAVAERFGAAFVDLWGLGKGSWYWMYDRDYWSDGSVASGLAGTDGVHLSNAGHAWWYSILAPIVFDQATPETITPPAAYKPKARLTQTASSGINPKTIVFDASTSFAAFPLTVATYTFDPGDGSGTTTQASPVYSHTYSTNGTFTPTVTVTDSAASTNTATGSAITISAFMHFQDFFTGTDGTLITAHTPDQGSAWTVHNLSGSSFTCGINGNQFALLSEGAGGPLVAVADTTVHDTTITYVCGADANPQVYVWYVDDSNYVSADGRGAITKVVAGSSTSLQAGSGATVSGDTVAIILAGTSLTVKLNGTTKGSAVTIADAVFTTATKLAVNFPFLGSVPKRVMDSIQAT